jgi:tetratricopeptide (TPR) repeat protein
MFNQAKNSFGGRRRFLVFSFAIITALGLMQTSMLSAFDASPAIEGKKLSPEAENRLEIARMQHDLIMLYIEKQDYDSIESAWKKVLDLRLDAEFENLVKKSLVIISDNLCDAKQPALALKLINESLMALPFSDKSKSDIFECKARLYKELKDLDSAIKAMQKSIEYRKKP